MILDAANLRLGRMATYAAKKALGGEEVTVINCGAAVITGRKKDIIEKYRHKLELGQPSKGPFIARRADLFVRRTIRGMLPRKRTRGREAFKRVKCFAQSPEGLDKAKVETIEKANISNANTLNFITVRELCRLIGK